MLKSTAKALSSARKQKGKPKSDAQPGVPADQGEELKSAKADQAFERPHQRVAGVRLWGFVRRQQDVRGKSPELLPEDIAIWYDRRRCRFQIVSDQTVVDDLAPVEFVQFVRALQYSTKQILFKFENRHDGTAGRPVSVWSSHVAAATVSVANQTSLKGS